MRQKIRKEILIGLLIGLVANISGSYLYIFFFSEYELETTVKIALEQDVLGNIIALGAILNLGVFFIFLKKNNYYRARGVILATLLAAMLIAIAKFY
jgi:Mg/Co/Ni transporter MgtE